jgi:hypothetical protein
VHQKHPKTLTQIPKSLLLLLLTLTLSTCTPTKPPFDETAKAQIIREATETLHAYYAAITNNGLLAEFDFLDSSNGFFWLPPGSTIAWDYDSVATTIRQNATQLDTISIAWTTLHVEAVAWDTAKYAGELHSRSISMEGDTSTARLIEKGFLIRRDDGWKLLSGETKMKE